MPDLNAYWGLIHTKPTLGFFFLMSGLGMSGFPITTTFLGQDLLLSHIEEGDFVMATLLALSFVLNGISIIRMYARVFLGHHQKSYLHSTPQTL
jgi:formate hydrogenlyase subunit 3/multisubunit Na+/H+ antiporter MnhD subunit